MRLTLCTIAGCVATSFSCCLCQVSLTAADAQALQNNTSLPNTHLVRALASQAQASLTNQYAASFVTPSAQASSDAYLQLVNQYQITKQNNDVATSILKTNDYMVKTAIVGGLTYSGVGVFVVPVADAVSDLVLGGVEKQFTDFGKDQLQRILKTGLDQVKQTNQTEYDRLTQMTSGQDFISVLDQDVKGLFGNSLNNLSQEDQQIVNAFKIEETNVIIKDGFAWVANTTSLQQSEIDGARQDIINLATTFDQFSTEMESRVDAVEADETSLQDSISTLQNDYGGQQDQINYLQTALFGTMTPIQRKAAISNGILNNLSPDEQKALSEETDIEAKNDAFQASVKDTLNGAGELLTVAGNIPGFSPQLLTAANNGLKGLQDAATAFTDFSSGNILAGISSLSSIFGLGGPDIEALRQQQIMQGIGALQQGQSVILDREKALIQGEQTIIQNQQQEMDALATISNQLQSAHQEEMDELQAIDADVLYNRQMIAQAASKPYFGCVAIVDGPHGDESYRNKNIDTAHLLYPTEAAFANLYNSSKQYFTDCFNVMMHFRSGGVGRFDPNLFNLESYKSSDSNGIGAFISKIYSPAFSLLTDKRIATVSADVNDARISSLFIPVTSVDGLASKLGHTLHPYVFNYGVGDSDYLSVPLSIDQILETARIVEDAHFYFMLVDVNGNIRPWHELVSAKDVGTNGYLYALPDTLELLDIGVAQQQLVSGDSLLTVIDEVISKWTESLADAKALGCTPPTASMPVICSTKYSPFAQKLLSNGIVEADRVSVYNETTSLLGADPILAHNYLLYKLRQEFAANGTSTLSYSLALSLDKPDLLKACIGDGWQLEQAADGTWSVQFDTKSIPLPSPAQVANGAFLQRPELQELLTERSRVVDEMATYDSIRIPDSDQRKTVNALLMLSVQKPY